MATISELPFGYIPGMCQCAYSICIKLRTVSFYSFNGATYGKQWNKNVCIAIIITFLVSWCKVQKSILSYNFCVCIFCAVKFVQKALIMT